MNKKGNAIFVGILFIIIVVVFALVFMFGYKALDDSFSSMYSDLELQEAQTVLSDTHSRYPAVLDGLMLLLFAGIWLGGIGSALVREEHPMIFGLFMFLMIFVLIAGIFLANSFEEIFQEDDLTSLTTTFPASYWLITHLFQVGIGMILSVALVVMAKNRG